MTGTLGAGMALLTAALFEGRQDWSSTTAIALLVLAAGCSERSPSSR